MTKSNISPLVLCFLIGSVAPIHAQAPSKVTVAELIPHTLGCYVDYNEYDTATPGSAAAKSHASYTITAVNTNGDITVLDSIGGGDPSGIHQLYYYFNSVGDLQAYADTALIHYMIPDTIAAGVTNVPNRWVDYFKLSAGPGVSYPIDTLNSVVVTSQGNVGVKVTISGVYVGIEKVTVPSSTSTYDSAYRFDITAFAKFSAAGGFVTANLTSTQSNWLVKGVGVIRTHAPIASTTLAGNPISTVGRETEMTAFGVASSGVAGTPASTPGINIYPDPASEDVTITLPKPAKQIFLYANDGRMIRSFDLFGNRTETLLWINDLPNGHYIAKIGYVDGSMGSSNMIVKH